MLQFNTNADRSDSGIVTSSGEGVIGNSGTLLNKLFVHCYHGYVLTI